MHVAESGNAECVRLLIDAGANMEAMNNVRAAIYRYPALCVFTCCVLLMFIGSIMNQYQSLCCDWKISVTLFLVICTFLILFVVL